MANDDINIRYQLLANQALATLKQLRGQFKQLQTGVDDVGRASNKTAGLVQQMSNNLSASIKGFIAFTIAAKTIRAFTGAIQDGFNRVLDFEDALVGVGKTTDLTGDELAKFGREAEKLSQEIPVASTEILDLSRAAGQLGIRGTSNLLKFAETAARLASATDLASETAITGLTRILRLTGDTEENVDRLGASLVQLGNNFNATESQILSAALALSQTTSGFSIGSDEVLGFATAIAEAGLGSQKAATAIGGILTDIAKAFSQGGKEARAFSRATGLSMEEVADVINKDAGTALDLLIGSLSDVSGDTIELTKRLTELGVQEKREIQVIQSLTKLRNTQSRAIRESSSAYQANTALNEESNRAFDTTSSILKQATEATLQLSKALLEKSGLAEALRFTGEQIALISNFWANYLNATDEAGKSTTDLTARVKELAGVEFGDFNVTNVEDLTRANELLVQKSKELKKEIDTITDTIDNRTAAGNVNLRLLKEELKTLEALRLKTVETASDLNTFKQSLLSEEEQEQRNKNLRASLEERSGIVQQFRDAELALAQQDFENLQLSQELENDVMFELLKKGLGEQEALRVASNAQRRLNEAKTEEEMLAARKKNLKEILTAEEKAAKEREKLEKLSAKARLQTTAGFFSFAAALVKDGSKEQFVLQKAAALAQAFVARGLAIAKANAVTPPANVPALAHAKIQSNLAIGTIIATAIKGFQDGGIVPGTATSGDRVLARVNSGEMILNRAQQAQLFDQINSPNSGQQEIVIHTTVNLDGEEVGKSVSRQVADGLSLGDVV